jgi:hypothetical protein
MTRQLIISLILGAMLVGACTSTEKAASADELEGTWDYTMTSQDKAVIGGELKSDSGYVSDDIAVRMGFDGKEWWQGFVFGGELWRLNGTPEGDVGTYTVSDDELTLDNGVSAITYRWVITGTDLSLEVLETCTPPNGQGRQCFTDRDSIENLETDLILVTEHTYTKSGDDGSYH